MNEYNPDPYRVLHLEPAATAGEVARAYRALMRTHHPDTAPPDAVPAERESRAQELHEIMDAYAVLGDPAKRAAYDRQRRASNPGACATEPPHGFVRRRTAHWPGAAGNRLRTGPR